MTGTLHEGVSTFLAISRNSRLRIRNVLDKSCRENQNTHFVFNTFSHKSHRLWDNVEKFSGDRRATNDVTVWRIRVACWINKAISTYAHAQVHASDYPPARTRTHAHTDQQVILNAFPRQQRFAKAPQCNVIRTLLLLLFMLKAVPITCMAHYFIHITVIQLEWTPQPLQRSLLRLTWQFCRLRKELGQRQNKT